MSDRLKEIAERADKATPGPWYPWCFDEGIGWSVVAGDHAEASGEVVADLDYTDTTAPQEENAEFIAHASEDITWLIAELEKRDKAIEELRKVLECERAEFRSGYRL